MMSWRVDVRPTAAIRLKYETPTSQSPLSTATVRQSSVLKQFQRLGPPESPRVFSWSGNPATGGLKLKGKSWFRF
jgi:hypothetical protein